MTGFCRYGRCGACDWCGEQQAAGEAREQEMAELGWGLDDPHPEDCLACAAGEPLRHFYEPAPDVESVAS